MAGMTNPLGVVTRERTVLGAVIVDAVGPCAMLDTDAGCEMWIHANSKTGLVWGGDKG